MNIFFDLDGTLIDISEKYFQVYKNFMEQKAMSPLSKKQFWQMVRREEKKENVLKKRDLIGGYKKFFLQHIESEEYIRHDRLFEYVLPVLQGLRQQGRELMLVTLRRNRHQAIKEIQKLKINKYFKKVFICSPSKIVGENYRVKARAIQAIASKKDVIVGDSRADIMAGKELGLQTIGVTSGIRNYNMIRKQKPNHIARDIRAIKKLHT